MKIEVKNSHKILIWIAAIVIFLFAYLKKEKIYVCFLQLFHKSAIIAHYNNNGQLDGEYIAYVNGRIYGKSFFKDGLKDGRCIWYDEKTGKKQREVFYKQGKLYGIENVYYKSGNLNYTSGWKNDKRFNSEYHYLDNGVLNTYNAFDSNKSSYNSFCYVTYDRTGKFHQILGAIFSSFIYSTCKDSIVALTDSYKYNCVKDLYISVATPPQLTPIVDIFINNNKLKKATIKENTIVIPNAFNKRGTYQINILGKLINKDGRIIKTDTLKTIINKE